MMKHGDIKHYNLHYLSVLGNPPGFRRPKGSRFEIWIVFANGFRGFAIFCGIVARLRTTFPEIFKILGGLAERLHAFAMCL